MENKIIIEESEMFESAFNHATVILVWSREDLKKLQKDICSCNYPGFPKAEAIFDNYPVIEAEGHAVVIWKHPICGWNWTHLSFDDCDKYNINRYVPKAIYDYSNKKYAADGWDYLNNVVLWPKPDWRALGYDSFEDMIDDIAKDHGSTGHKYAGEWVDEIYPDTFDGHLIADSYRDCIIDIYDTENDKHAIINAPCATVYLPDKAKDKDLELTQDEIKWVKDNYKAIEEQKKAIRKIFGSGRFA